MNLRGPVGFLVALVVLVAVVYCVRLLLPLLGIPEPFQTVLLIILGLVALFYVLNYAGWVSWPGA